MLIGYAQMQFRYQMTHIKIRATPRRDLRQIQRHPRVKRQQHIDHITSHILSRDRFQTFVVKFVLYYFQETHELVRVLDDCYSLDFFEGSWGYKERGNVGLCTISDVYARDCHHWYSVYALCGFWGLLVGY